MRNPSKSVEIFIDGASRGNPGPASAAFIIKDLEGNPLVRRSLFIGENTNNVAEYFALTLALDEAKRLGAHEAVVKSDSELITKQMRGEYRIKNSTLKLFFKKAKNLAARFDAIDFVHINRSENKEADRLANAELDEFGE
jgi:ribonuclease HI